MRRLMPTVEVNLVFEPDVTPEMRLSVENGIELVGGRLGNLALTCLPDTAIGDGGEVIDVAERPLWTPFISDQITVVGTNRQPVNSRSRTDLIPMGFALMDMNVAVVSTSVALGRRCVKTITAHEIAHLNGIKDPRNKKHDASHRHHCADTNCIMFFKGNSTLDEEFFADIKKDLSVKVDDGTVLNEAELGFIEMIDKLAEDNEKSKLALDFCEDCLTDIDRARLRLARAQQQ